MLLRTTSLSCTNLGRKSRAPIPLATYSLSSNNSVNEGESLIVSVTTSNVADSTVLYWSTSNITTTDPDFSATSGTTTITSNSGSFSLPTVADSTTEGAETFGITLRSGSQSGPIVASTTNKTINDTSQTPPPPSYSASSASSINEGSALGVTVTTTNVSDGTTLYWTTNHTTTNAADFSSNSGSFTITSNSAVFNVPVVADSTTEGSETFTVEIRTTSTSGTIVATLPSVTVNDTSLDSGGWNLAFAEYVQKSTNNTTNAGKGFTFAGNGTKVYVQRSTSLKSDTYQYSLATAWDISSSISSDGLFTSSRDDGFGVKWKPDGSRFYWFNSDEDRIQQHTISSSSEYWNMLATSRTYNGETFFANSYETLLTDIAFSGDGTKIFITGITNDKIHAFSLSTAWDVLSTVTHLGSSSAFSFDPYKIDMKSDGTIFYITSDTQNIYQFEPTTAYDVTTIPSTPSHILSTSAVLPTSSNLPRNAYIKDGTQLFTYGNNGSIYEFDLTNNFKNPSDYSHTRFDRINVAASTAVEGVEFDPTGTIMYTIDSSDSIKQQTLSTAWDISTAGSPTRTLSLYDGSGFTSPQEVRFKPDGTTMWVCDTFGNIREYPLSSPWTIPSSVTHTKQRDFGTRVFGFVWKPDGTALYTIDGSSDRVKQREFATAWDINSTMTTTQSVDLDLSTTASETACRSMYLSPDGLKLYITGGNQDKIQMYNLSTAWDITSFSGTPDDTLDVSSYETSPNCITFSPGGKYMYIGGAGDDGVDQFTVT